MLILSARACPARSRWAVHLAVSRGYTTLTRKHAADAPDSRVDEVSDLEGSSHSRVPSHPHARRRETNQTIGKHAEIRIPKHSRLRSCFCDHFHRPSRLSPSTLDAKHCKSGPNSCLVS